MARSLIAFFVAATALMGCSSGPSTEVKLGVDVAAIKAAADTATAADSALQLSRVRVLIADAKIGYTGGKSTGPSAEVGPFVVDLTADEIAKGAHREFSLGSLASGTYGGAEIEIEPLDASAATTDPAFDDFRAARASLLIDGTYQGKSFQFAGHFLAEQGTDGEVTVDASVPVALTMAVDPSTWFLDATGLAADPADTTQHDALSVAICKTLDTEPQLAKGPGGRGPQGGGQGAHCVEQAAP